MKLLKYLNITLLLILISTDIIILAAYFEQRKKTEELEKAVQALEEELSPFSKTPDTYFEASTEAVGAITSIESDRKIHNFGVVKAGGVYTTSFTITNTGNENLIISKAIGSCGCTVGEWDTKPIKPGDKTTLTVNFDSKGKSGEQLQTLSVTTNTEPSVTVFSIKAIVQ